MLQSTRFTVQTDNDLKDTEKTTQDFIKAKKVQCSAITPPQSNRAFISMTEGKAEGKMPKDQAGTAAVKALQSFTREDKWHLMMNSN